VSRLAIEYRPLASLIPYARNARTHSDEQVAQIAASIKEFGWTNPVLVDGESGIIAGHGRVLAARQLGVDPVPCIELAGLSEAQRRAYILADNKLALNAGWDEALLRVELADLRGMAFDLSLIGFGEAEQAAILNKTEGLTDPDDAPAAPEHPVSELGDLWLLGRHRLLCGDSTVATDVERVLGAVEPHLMVTDPPYGVEYDPDWRNRAERASTGRPIGARATSRVENDGQSDWREAWALFPGEVTYVWHADPHASVVQASIEAAGFEIRCQIVWAKPRFVISRGHYHWQHEPCWYAVRKGKAGHWSGDRSQTTLWQITHLKSETGHGTQKPVECMRRPIENNSSPGQAVYEPFSGSGTTIIAAEMTARSCHAIELSPAYVDVAVKRWQDFTGKQAVLDGDGRTFDEVASERAKAETNAPKASHRQSGAPTTKGRAGADKRTAAAAT
jgi:DNA modification methylase